MSTLVLKNIDQALLKEIGELAAANDVSIEEQATRLLKQTARQEFRRDRTRRLAAIAAMTPINIEQVDSVALLREDRDR